MNRIEGINKDDIRLIALDLDGTLLDSEKRLSERNRKALEAAAAKGIHIVPATGRVRNAIPEVIRQLPFIRYYLTVNGASVEDMKCPDPIYTADIPLERTLEVMRVLEEYPAIYDCYQDGRGYMTEDMYQRAGYYTTSPHVLELIRRIRIPVPELKAYLKEKGRPVQKVQLFFHQPKDRDIFMPKLIQRLPDLVLTTSFNNNIEINAAQATKGRALRELAHALGISPESCMAFGDSYNDVTMLETAGIGVAMGNADPAIQRLADVVTLSNDQDGVAHVVEQLIR